MNDLDAPRRRMRTQPDTPPDAARTPAESTPSARGAFVDAAVAYLLGERGVPTDPDGAVRTTGVRGGAARRDAERPSASALGIRLVAELTGRSHAAPLHHFPDRLSLVAAVAAEGFRRQVRWVAGEMGCAPAGRGADRLQRCALAYVTWASRAPALFATMYDPELAPVLEAFMLHAGDEDGLRAALPVHLGGDPRQSARRLVAYTELFEAKQRALELFLGAARAGQRDGSLRTDEDALHLAHAATAVADGLAWQHVTETQFAGPLLEAHTRRTIRLCVEGVGGR